MTVKELIAILNKMPEDADVELKHWEDGEDGMIGWWSSMLEREQITLKYPLPGYYGEKTVYLGE